MTPDEQVNARAQLDYQRKAVASAIEELDELLITRAKGDDVLTFETDESRLSVVVRSYRTVDPEMIEQIVGPEIFKMYGAQKLTMEQYKRMLNHPGLNPETLAKLKSAVGSRTSEPSIKVEPREFTTD